MKTEGRIPYDLNAEETAVTAVIHDPSVLKKLTQEMFISPRCTKLFEAMKAIEERGSEIDEISIHAELKRIDKLESHEKLSYLHEIADIFNRQQVNARYASQGAIDVLNNMAYRRKLQIIGKNLYLKAIDDKDIHQVVDSVVKELNVTGNGKSKEGTKYWDLFQEIIEIIDNKNESGETKGYKSGLSDLDSIIGYFHFGHLDIIGARPAMGKTSLAMNFALHASLRNNINTLVISAELGALELATQIASIHTSVPIQRMDTAIIEGTDLSTEDWEKLTEKGSESKNLPLIIDDFSGTPREVLISIRDHVAKHKIQTVFIDYIQLIKTYEQYGQHTRASALGEFSYDLKRLAKELNIHIVCICQLNRQVESRPDKRPMLSDLKESGDLEQVAYKVILIYRDEVYNENSDEEGIAELIVAKNRRGRTGVSRVGFFGDCTQFNNLTNRNKYE